jgi:DNA-binding MarR family transcriptional regulator
MILQKREVSCHHNDAEDSFTVMKTDGVSQKKRAEVLKMSEASLSRILDRLEDYALVRREGPGIEKIVRASV